MGLAGSGAGRWATWSGQCAVCRTWNRARLCADCARRFATPGHRCESCGLAIAVGLSHCNDCLREPPPFTRCVCAVDYQFPWDRLIHRFKFQQSPELAALLVEPLLTAARQHAAPRPELFVPVPVSDVRLQQRGYDQAWELARRIAHALTVTAHARALVRPVDRTRQSALGRTARLANLRGAFNVPVSARNAVQGRHVGLVDDVMTTGATAHAAAAALLSAGAARVDLWVVARTPAPEFGLGAEP
jgi:ComF family protein